MASSPFLNEVRTSIRLRGMSLRTEKTYVYWIRYFIRYHNFRHPSDMGDSEVMAFLGFLASQRNVAVNTQRVALNALAYLYNQFLKVPLGDLEFSQEVRSGRDIRTVQELLGHADVSTTQIYTHVLGNHFAGTASPLDQL